MVKLTRKGHEGISGIGGNVLYLDKGLGCTGVCIFQNSLNGTLEIFAFHCM